MAVPCNRRRHCAVQNLAAGLPALGISLHDGHLQLAARNDGSATIQGRIGAGDGVLQVAGDLDWRSDDTPLQLTLRGNSVLLADTRQLRIVADPDVSLRYRTGQPLQLRGQVSLTQADIHLERLDMGVSPSTMWWCWIDAATYPVAGLALDMDLSLLMGKAVQLDGFGLQGSLSGGLRVRAQPGRDVLGNGALQVEGRYRAYGRTCKSRGVVCAGRTRRWVIRAWIFAPNAMWVMSPPASAWKGARKRRRRPCIRSRPRASPKRWPISP